MEKVESAATCSSLEWEIAMDSKKDKKKALIIDDNRENIVFLANYILKPGGYEVITAMDGENGLKKALTENPDLIITDLRMPKMSGIEVLKALREEGKDVPVIVTTFHGSEELAVQAFRLGVKDYLIKPFTIEEMQEAIARALSSEREVKAPPPAEVDLELAEEAMEVNELLQKSIDELGALHDVGRALTSILKPEKVLALAVEAAVPIAEAEESSIFLMEGGKLYLKAIYKFGEEHARTVNQKIEEKLVAQVIDTCQAVNIQRFGEGGREPQPECSLMIVPMKKGQEVIGALTVMSQAPDKDFTDNELYLLSILVDYAAIAFNNACLYQDMNREIERLSKRGAPAPEVHINQIEAEQLARQLRALTLMAERLAQRLSS